MEAHPVVHLVNFPLNGHVLSTQCEHAGDCWCEPAKLFWVKNNHGVLILVVEHNDYTDAHRVQQLADQERGVPEVLAWINHVLYNPGMYPTAEHRDIQARGFKQLPPHGEKGTE